MPTTPRRIRCRGRLRVALPPAEALALFTPEGERAWVDGWDPAYPGGQPPDPTEPGVVFVTGNGGRTTVWVVAQRQADLMRYARVTPGHMAGTVTVACRGDDATEVEVTYDLTAVAAAATGDLEAFAAGYDDFLAGWERDIRAWLAR